MNNFGDIPSQTFPASHDQARIALLSQLSPAMALAFNISGMFRIFGECRPDIAEAVVRQIVEKHSSLRTVFVAGPDGLQRVVQWQVQTPVTFHDCRDQPDPEAAMLAIYRQRLDTPFDIAAAPPFEVSICRTADQAHVVILTFHHINSDYQTALLFSREFQLHYEYAIGGNPEHHLPAFEDDELAYAELGDKEQKYFAKYAAKILEKIKDIPELTLGRQLPLFARSMRLDNRIFALPSTLDQRVQATAEALQCSVPAVYLAAWSVIIQQLGQQSQFVLGMPIDVRPGKPHRGAFGYLSKPSFMVFDADQYATTADLIRHMDAQIKEALRMRFFPLAELYGQAGKLPRIQVLFNYLSTWEMNNPGCSTTLEPILAGFTHSDMDLWFTVLDTVAGIRIKLEFSADRFAADAFDGFAQTVQHTLDALCQPGATVLAPLLHQPQPAAERPRLAGVVAASFTLDPLQAVWHSLADSLGADLDFGLQPYHQVMQTLLAPEMPPAPRGKATTLSLLVRIEDFFRHAAEISPKQIDTLLVELSGACKISLVNKERPHLLILCPSTTPRPEFRQASAALVELLAGINGLTVLDWSATGDTGDFAAEAEHLAHIPYEAPLYHDLALQVLQFTYHETVAAPKVLVLDCDNTLWQGVIGEDGLSGISVTPAHQRLQQQLLQLQQGGVLLVLASKNNEADALQVFDQHPDMQLRREHIVSHRINWGNKAANVADMAAELNLGLNAFAFLDDNPVEIQQMQQLLPEVLALQVPTDLEQLDRWRDQLWLFRYRLHNAFDRTKTYQEEVARKQFRSSQQSLASFIAGLALQVAFLPVDDQHLPRAAQLTQRTNQFNLTGDKYTEVSLQNLLAHDDAVGMLLSCQDSFGDYGIVGLLLLRRQRKLLAVQNVWLSCRVLARGVELAIVNWLRDFAAANACDTLRFSYKDTGRNLPGLHFLQAVNTFAGSTFDDYGHADLPRDALQGIGIEAFLQQAPVDDAPPAAAPAAASRSLEAQLLQRVTSYSRPTRVVGSAAVADSAIQARLAAIWQDALGKPLLGPGSFFELGGTSLAAVSLLIKLNREFDLELAVQDVYNFAEFEQLLGLISNKLQHADSDHDQPVYQQMLRDIELSYADVPFQPEWQRQPATQQRQFLLTGATGFVGVHLLRDLLRERQDRVFCVVRAANADDAKRRLQAALERYQVALGADEWQRIQPLAGDLCQPRLGLAAELWQQLQQNISHIIHCGAKVNFFEGYSQLRQANVESTRQLILLCAAGQAKKLTFVSSIGVLHGDRHIQLPEFRESVASGTPEGLPTGYQQTKWVSEKLIGRAVERGIDAGIVRLGTVAGNATTGVLNTADLFVHLFNSVNRLGVVPEMRAMDFLPVEFIADTIARLSVQPVTAGRVFHLTNSNTVSVRQLSRWAMVAGTALRVVPFADWRQEMLRFFKDNPSDPFARYEPLFYQGKNAPSFIEILLKAPQADTSQTRQFLLQQKRDFPPITPALLQVYNTAFVDSGLAVADASAAIANSLNLFYIVEEMTGFVAPCDQPQPSDDACLAAYQAGRAAAQRLSLDFVGHIPDFASLLQHNRIYLNGSIHCPLLDLQPLQVRQGYFEVAPFDGYRPGQADSLLFLVYHVELQATDGTTYTLRGRKVNRDLPSLFFEVTEILFTLSDDQNPARRVAGKVGTPFAQLFHDQIRKMTFREGLSTKQQVACQTFWIMYLSAAFLKNYLKLALRQPPWSWADLVQIAGQIPTIRGGYAQLLDWGKTLAKSGLMSKFFNR